MLTAFAALRHSVGQGLGLGAVLLGRDLVDGVMKIGQDVLEGRLVFQVEGQEFIEDVAAFAQARMSKDLPAGDHVDGDAAEARGDLDMGMLGVLAGGFPGGSAHAGRGVAEDEIVGDAEDGGTKGAAGAADEGPVCAVDAIALIACGEESGAAGDALGVGVVFDGSHFAGEVGDGDDVDAWKTQMTSKGLRQLKGLTSLDTLDLTNSEVTAQAVADLQQALPECRIIAAAP